MRLRVGNVLWMVVVVALAVSTPALAGGETNVFLGQKDVKDLDDDLDEFGVALTFGGDWPVAIAVDILRGDISESYTYYYVGDGGVYTANAEAEVLEVNLGVRKTFLDGKVQPYVGGGVVWADLDFSVSVPGLGSFSESDSGVGFWGNAGVLFRIGERFNVGVDVRRSDVDADIEGESVEIGGTHYGVLLGFRWGG